MALISSFKVAWRTMTYEVEPINISFLYPRLQPVRNASWGPD